MFLLWEMIGKESLISLRINARLCISQEPKEYQRLKSKKICCLINMFREMMISVYLWICKVLFVLFSNFSLKQKVTFVVSFGENIQYVYNEMLRQQIPYDVVF